MLKLGSSKINKSDNSPEDILGINRLNFKGKYDINTVYSVGDVVSDVDNKIYVYDGNKFIELSPPKSVR